ncbi:hypothetical protein, partial [Enterovibrio nigricans]|uniref:hypothetical protein n=1 Tax=Enterovibrio nigricans TaxID=504469 RepID=UPI001FCD38A0
GLDMRLRRLMGVADQIVASRFSSIDLSNKAHARSRRFNPSNGRRRYRVANSDSVGWIQWD